MRPNRYDRKRKHKRVLKKRHAVKFDRFDPLLDEEKERNDYWDDLVNYPRAKWIDHRNGGYTYWNQFYISGPRGFAKRSTNRKIRSEFRDLLANEHPDNIPTLRGADYEKWFDYMWTIW